MSILWSIKKTVSQLGGKIESTEWGQTGGWICPGCGTRRASTDAFCVQCGGKKPVISENMCQCGRAFRQGERFCRTCGTQRPVSVPRGSGIAAEQPVCVCNRVFQDDEMFCPNCSRRRPMDAVQVKPKKPDIMQNRCSQCGNALDGSEIFCMICGTRLPSTGVQASDGIEEDLPDILDYNHSEANEETLFIPEEEQTPESGEPETRIFISDDLSNAQDITIKKLDL